MGIIDSLKNLFGGNEKAPNVENSQTREFGYNSDYEGLIHDIIQDIHRIYGTGWWYNISLSKSENYQQLKKKNTSFRKDLVLYLTNKICRRSKKNQRYNAYDEDQKLDAAYSEILFGLLRSNLNYTPQEIIELFLLFKKGDENHFKRFSSWPIGFASQQVERLVKADGLSQELRSFLEKFLLWKQMKQSKGYYGSDLEKVRVRIEKLLFEGSGSPRHAPYTLPGDRLGKLINPEITQLESEVQDHFYGLFHLFIKANSSKPSTRYLKSTSKLIDAIGIANYKEKVHAWLEFVISLEPVETVEIYHYGRNEHRYTTYLFLNDKNSVFLKGLVWSLAKFHDSKTLNLLGKFTEKAFKKIPGVGPTAAAVGNACIYVLGNTRGLEGVSHLSRLKLKIKQNNTRRLILKYLDEASKKLGVSPSEIEELSIPDFGLQDGKKSFKFEDYTLHIAIADLGKVNLSWEKPDGSAQKTTPSFIKSSTKHKELLKKAKADVAQIKKYLTAQRDRIDRLYLENRVWNYSDYLKSYLNHGLVGFIAEKLLWQVEKDAEFITVLQHEGKWLDKNEAEIDWIDESTKIRLWHPIHSEIEEILYWRNRLETLKIKQPLKQAYREVYILTDAEINTTVYSNRMAAHIIKQHQFNALTGIRGWRYSLMGAYDDGRDAEVASIHMSAYNMTAEFWINEIASDDQFNDAGIWNYVATDQVRFIKDHTHTTNLIDVPKLVFSEIMRDVDLFVGVCSVGNDPEWRDNGGLPQYRDYWTSYSFGNLTEIAKTRKEILEKLLPRLKIKDVSSIEGRFLKVKGTKRTYKIHIGSSNILMEPNDQYLCIVPARGKDTNTSNVFLPFEGDRGLSLVLSKAFLLAADDKITDSTILSQINR